MQMNLMSRPTGGGALPHVPSVAYSEINPTNPDGILVHWDRPIIATAHIKDAITLIINGGAPIAPQAVVIQPGSPNMMAIIHHPDFKLTDVVTWAYNDQHPTENLKDAKGVEVDNQTHGVTNNINHGAPKGAFSHAFDASFN